MSSRAATCCLAACLAPALVFGWVGCTAADTVDLPLRACVEGASRAAVGADGTIAVWGSFATPQGGYAHHAAVLASNLNGTSSLPVPSEAMFPYSGEVLDLTADGASDVLILGSAGPASSHAAFLWTSRDPARGPTVATLQTGLSMTAAAEDRVYGADDHGRIEVLSWKDGVLAASLVADPSLPGGEAPAGFVGRCLRHGDVDQDGLSELVLGGTVGTTASLLIVHEDGRGAHVVSLGEPGWVADVGMVADSREIVLAVRTSLLQDLSAGFSQTHESVYSTRLVLARATPDHQVALIEGKDTVCPIPGWLSEATLAYLGNGELAVGWCAGSLPDGPGAPPAWVRSTIRVYRLAEGGLVETARRDLEGAWRLLGAGPAPGPGAGGVLLARLASANAPPDYSPGVYIIERRGSERKLRHLTVEKR